MYGFQIETYVKVQTLIALCLNVGEFVNGYGVAWSAPIIIKLQDPEQTPLPHLITETQSYWIGSAIFFGGFGAFLCGYLVNKIGRKKCLVISGIINLLFYILLTAARTLTMVYIGRLLVGITMFMISLTGLIYNGEIASPNIRGTILSCMGVFHALGGLLVYSIGPYISYTEVGYVVIGLNVLYIVGCCQLPESPMFYVLKDDEASARTVLQNLGRTTDINTELKQMLDSIRERQDNKQILRELFTTKSDIKSLFITTSLTFFQQCSGIIAVIFFATTIFKNAGSSVRPDIATIIVGATSAIGTMLSPIFIEKCGRRILLLVSTAGCSLSMAVLGIYFYMISINSSTTNTLGWLPLTSLVVALFSYSVGLTTIPNTLCSELYSPKVRGLGSSISMSAGLMTGLASTTAFGYVVFALGSHVTFWIFSLINAGGFIFVALFVPETKGKSLMQIQAMLDR